MKRLEETVVEEDMGSYLRDNGGGWESVMKRLEETHQKYRMVETSLLNRRQRFLPLPLFSQGMEEGEGGGLPPQPPPEVPSSSALLSRHGGR